MFDALTLAAVTDELRVTVQGGRIQRVVLLDDLSVGLEIYAGRRYQVLLSAHPTDARVHLVAARLTADRERVTPFLLLLRKYLRGGRLLAVEQPPLERVVALSIAKHFYLDNPDDQSEASGADEEEPAAGDERPGYDVRVTLVAEIMGRHSNLVLVDSSGTILDSVKRVPSSLSRYRVILPHQAYQPPPAQQKDDPRSLDEDWWTRVQAGSAPTEALAPVLVRTLRGMSPQMAREVVFRACRAIDAPVAAAADGSALRQALADVLAPLTTHAWAPHLYREHDRPAAFAPVPLHSLAHLNAEPMASISAAAEAFYQSTRQVVGHGQLRARLIEQLREERARVRARRQSLQEQLAGATAAERWREAGQLIYAFIHSLRPGQTRLEVEGQTIELDPARTPVENAQAYFERYRRAQSAAANLPELVQAAENETAYLDQLIALAATASRFDELQELEAEWRAHAAPATPAARRRPKPAPRGPHRLRTVRGDLILVGRTGQQNEQVTFDLSGPDALWLHARGVPGAHVVLQWSGAPEDRFLEAAAELAAYYSAAASAGRVEVDVTERRWVRKIKGTPPGLVTYRNERTVRVAPASEDELRSRGLLAPGGQRGERS